MKFLRYSAVVIAFLVGWIGVAVFIDGFIKELIPEPYADRNVLLDWLQSPGSVVGLPVGCLLAYICSESLKRKGER